jgi:uncharacterized membrane protein
MIAAMPTFLVIVGVGITLLGVALILLARFERPTAGHEEAINPAQILEQFNNLLKLIEARYRIGIVLIAVGLTLVGVGAWWEARDAKDQAEALAAFLAAGR